MSDDRLDEERGGWLTLMEAKDAEIARLNDVVGRMDREHEMLLDRLQDAEGEMREEIARLTAELRRVREVKLAPYWWSTIRQARGPVER